MNDHGKYLQLWDHCIPMKSPHQALAYRSGMQLGTVELELRYYCWWKGFLFIWWVDVELCRPQDQEFLTQIMAQCSQVIGVSREELSFCAQKNWKVVTPKLSSVGAKGWIASSCSLAHVELTVFFWTFNLRVKKIEGRYVMIWVSGSPPCGRLSVTWCFKISSRGRMGWPLPASRCIVSIHGSLFSPRFFSDPFWVPFDHGFEIQWSIPFEHMNSLGHLGPQTKKIIKNIGIQISNVWTIWESRNSQALRLVRITRIVKVARLARVLRWGRCQTLYFFIVKCTVREFK